jgi:hypothetical protein
MLDVIAGGVLGAIATAAAVWWYKKKNIENQPSHGSIKNQPVRFSNVEPSMQVATDDGVYVKQRPANDWSFFMSRDVSDADAGYTDGSGELE